MAENRITKKWLKNYWTYNWWKYLILVVCCAVGVDLLFSVTAYRVPEEKKLELYMCSGFVDTQMLHDEIWPGFSEEHPDQEELTVYNIDLTMDDMYAQMQFSTYIGAQQGDVCLLPESMVKSLTAEGADYSFLELTPYIDSGVIDVSGVDMTGGVFKNEAGEEGVYAIPADSLYGLMRYGTNPKDSYLCVLAYCGNDANAAALIDRMIELYQTEAPAGGGGTQSEAQTVIFN